MDKTSIDFNGNPVAPEAGQSEKEETQEVKESEVAEKPKQEEPVEEPKAEETPTEDIETLPDWAKARLEKAESEKENYKKGMLKYKKFSLTKEEEPKKETEEEYPDWDDASKKFQKQTLSQAEKRAEAKAQAIIEKASEKAAISAFLSDHPEVKDNWDDVVANYSPKNGKETQADIIKDLERALVLTQYEKGTLNKVDKKGEKAVANFNTVSKTTSKSVPEGSTLSKGSLKFAERMRVDPKKLAQEDDSPIAEIKF